MRYVTLPFLLIGLLQAAVPTAPTPGQTSDRWKQARIELPSIQIAERGSVAPDGTSLAMVLDEGLTVIDLRTKHTRLIVPKKQGFSPALPFWSPDGREIAFVTSTFTTEVQTELRVVSSTGGDSHVVYSHAHYGSLQGWSRDGRFLLANYVDYDKDSPPEELLAVAIRDGSAHAIASSPSDGIRRAAYSPDNRFVVFDSSSSHALSSLTVVGADGLGTHALLADAHTGDTLLDWSSDGDVVILRDGNVLAIPTSKGRSVAAPVTVSAGIGSARSLGFAAGHKLFLLKMVRDFDLYVATLDPSMGTIVGSIVPVPDSRPEITRGPPVWSPDGTRLAFGTTGGKWTVRTMATGAERQYQVDLQDARNPVWQPDGRALVIHGAQSITRNGFFRLDLDTGSVEFLWPGFRLFYGPDGRDVVYNVGPKGSEAYVLRNLSTGVETTIDTHGLFGAMALSHKGSLLAMSNPARKTISVLSLDGSVRRTLASDVSDITSTNFEFSPDDRFIYFVTGGGAVDKVWRIPVAGGAPQATGVSMRIIHDMSLSPDGTRLAMKINSRVMEVWTLR